MKLFKQITANNVTLTPYPFKKELAMEAYLIENEEILSLDNVNFEDVSVLDVEIALKKGRRDRDGRIDILSVYGGEYLSIIELKLNVIDDNALSQLEEYLDQRNQILEIGDYWKEESEPKWIGVLVGGSISAGLQEKLNQGYTHNEIPIAGMVLNRYRADDGSVFVVSDTYFSYSYSTKDYSKFIFNNLELGKGPLVNEVVRKFVETYPETTFADLRKAFPNEIQGSLGVFDTLTKAEEVFAMSGRKRHNIKPSKVIKLADGEIIATSTQWNPNNIKDFVLKAQVLGMKIENA